MTVAGVGKMLPGQRNDAECQGMATTVVGRWINDGHHACSIRKGEDKIKSDELLENEVPND